MRKGIILIIGLLFLTVMSFSTYAMPDESIALVPALVDAHFENDVLSIHNKDTKTIQLENAKIQLRYEGNITQFEGLKNLKTNVRIDKEMISQKSHAQGNVYNIHILKTNQALLLPDETIFFHVQTIGKGNPNGLKLYVQERVPVTVSVTTKNESWTTTISICNKTTSPIPLRDVEFSFNYSSTMPTSIWGQPWVAWRVGSQVGNRVTLLGGTSYTSPLQPDPNCTAPLTIQFNAAPSTPLPTGPFTFKATGATPPPPGQCLPPVNIKSSYTSDKKSASITWDAPANSSPILNYQVNDWADKLLWKGANPPFVDNTLPGTSGRFTYYLYSNCSSGLSARVQYILVIDDTPPPPLTGKLSVTMPAMPASGISNPEVTVTGMGTTNKQVVAWGGTWEIINLAPGSYTVTAAGVNNSSDFFTAAPIVVNVTAETTATANVVYEAVPSGSISLTLTNAPQTTVPISFVGQKYNIQKTLSSGTSFRLPHDTYNVSSVIPGYTATITPNPLVVPTNTSLSISYQNTTPPPPITGPRFVGYYQSWSPDSQTTDGSRTNLANLPSYVTIVNLSFVKPDAVYAKGSLNLAGTGLEFNYSGTVLKQAVTTLHQRNSKTKVLAAIGGAEYGNWSALNARAIADLVADLGLDGVDIDYEPATTGCALGSDNLIHCQIDAAFQGFVQALRTALPRPLMVTVTGFSTAAYGEGEWRTAPPSGQYTGMMLPLLRSAVASGIDMVNVMSYDAGTTYNPVQALAAYSNFYKGPINMGVEVPPEAWGGNVYTLCKVIQLVQAVKTTAAQRQGFPGMMLWSLQKAPTGPVTPNNPSAQMMATTICNELGMANCTQKILINGLTENLMTPLKLLCN